MAWTKASITMEDSTWGDLEDALGGWGIRSEEEEVVEDLYDQGSTVTTSFSFSGSGSTTTILPSEKGNAESMKTNSFPTSSQSISTLPPSSPSTSQKNEPSEICER